MAIHRDNTVDTRERCSRAVLIVDMINALDFHGGIAMLPAALQAAQRIVALKRAARTAGVPVIYVNDNFGRWRSDFREVVTSCMTAQSTGRPLAELLRPDRDDYFVLKPKQSAFFATPLEVLLQTLGVEELVVTGIAADACVLFTAMDAHLRGYRLRVPADATAAVSSARHQRALEQIRDVLHGDTAPIGDSLAWLDGPGRRAAA